MRDSFFQEYASIAVGLAIGSAAHLGKLLSEGKMPSWLQVAGYFLQLFLVGLVCAVVTKRIGITDEDFRALSAAIMALSAQETIQYIKKWVRDHVTVKLSLPPNDDPKP